MHNYWLSCMLRESQTLTSIFLLKHNYSLTWLTYHYHHISKLLQRIKFILSNDLHDFFIISFLNIYHFGTSFIHCNWFWQAQINLSEEHEHKIFISQNDISEAWENFFKITKSHINLSESWEHFFKNIKEHHAQKI